MLSIGQLAEATGETVKTLRYWTGLGLLVAERGENNYRYYREAMTERTAFIRGAQALGFTLAEIRNILSLRENGQPPCTEVKQQLARHLAKVRARMAELRQLEAELADRLRWAESHPDPACDADGCVYLAN
ncbi:MAG TPA: MerR family DNA-binding protein [Trueperaceae bacterium]